MEYDKNDEVYSKAVRAGKRTYFFDVKATKGKDLYITITESKKVSQDGREFYQKHKIFLYKEDFEKFANGFTDVVSKIEELRATGEFKADTPIPAEEKPVDDFSEVSFDDL
ncbi:MAG: DUF3276 family protein [Crocinitomicaceae bacterium]|nr:DUF3276 family protein [Crocinitomicaceae bacterium]